MNRRGFLGSILALGAAPAIVKAESLMRIAAPAAEVFTWHQETVIIDLTPFPRTEECNQAMIDQICERLRHAHRTMAQNITSDLYSNRRIAAG